VLVKLGPLDTGRIADLRPYFDSVPDPRARRGREILRAHGIEPAPERDRQTWAAFLRTQAHAILACDFFTATTLNGASVYVFAVVEYANRRIRVLGATAHPTAEWAA
jgi:hypothetical protein